MTRTVRFRQFAASTQSILEELLASLVDGGQRLGSKSAAKWAIDFRQAASSWSTAAALHDVYSLAKMPAADTWTAAFAAIGERGFALVLLPPAGTSIPVGTFCAVVDAVSDRFGQWRGSAGAAEQLAIADRAASAAILLHHGAARSLLVHAADGSICLMKHEAQTGVSGSTLWSAAQGAGTDVDGLLVSTWALLLARTCGLDHAAFATLGGATLGKVELRTIDLVGCKTLSDLLGAAHAGTGAPLIGAAQLANWPEHVDRQPVYETLLDTTGTGADAIGLTFHLRAETGSDGPVTLLARQLPGGESDPIRAFLKGASLTANFARLLDATSTAGPDSALCALDMLDPVERAELLRLASPDVELVGASPCPITRFEAIAAAQPEALALVSDSDGDALTYAQIDRRANALAHRLIKVGCGPERICAINLPRGMDFIIAMLAVLKCGGAFLPLDMALPETERSIRAAEAGADAVIGHEGLAGLAVAVLAPDAAQRDDPPARPAPDGGRLAYLIHTSGSTGRPKGVMGTTGALSAHASAVIAAYGLHAEDRVLHFASPGFDVALEEIFPTLLSGALLVVRAEDRAESINAFLTLLQARKLTVLNLPASFWHVLVTEMAHRNLRLPETLRLVVTGSERILPAALAQWQQLAPGCRWINGYGPTETTITATIHAPDLTGPPVDPVDDVPIGRPLAHATAYVLAFDGSLAPLGAEGTLHIGGPAVTRGYLHQPEATAEVFGPDPFGSAGARLYNTGDRARWRPDGALDFLGRRDRQVKLRGQRIDLGEIERALGQFDGVREARVAVDAAGTDAARLIAWVTGPDMAEDRPLPAGLVENVARHMLGATRPVIVPVSGFPLKPNGKVDMAALPRPVLRNVAAEAGPVDAQTEAVLACLAEVLGKGATDPDTDIRDLGANSLVALRLASVLEGRFGRPVVATDLYRNPTARKIARFLETEVDVPRTVVPIQTGGTKPPFLAVHVLGEKEMLFRPLAAALGPDYPVYGLTVGPPSSLSEVTVEGIARRYFEDVQKAFPQGPIALGGVSMAAYFAYELAQQLIAAGRDVRVLAAIDADGPGGRPALRGMRRLGAHMRQFLTHGIDHLAAIARSRIEARREARELAKTPPDEVTGLSLVMANVHAVESYQPAPFTRPIAVFRAGDSYWDSDEALRSKLGWEPVARGGLTMVDVPGDHLTLLHAQNVGQMAQHLAMLIGGV